MNDEGFSFGLIDRGRDKATRENAKKKKEGQSGWPSRKEAVFAV